MRSFLCKSDAVYEREGCVLFQVQNDGRIWPAFAIRFNDHVYAYLDVCAHAGIELSGEDENVFSGDRQRLACNAHGAMFMPDTGGCVSGPCLGLSLIPVSVIETHEGIFCTDQKYEYRTSV